MNRLTFGIAIAAALSLMTGTVRASSILAVDFDQTGNGATQAGFESFAGTTFSGLGGPVSQTFGDLTVTVSGHFGHLSRTGIQNRDDLTFADLYSDSVYFTNAGDRAIAVEIAGLAPLTQYELIFYAYEHFWNTGTEDTTFAPTAGSGTTGASGTVHYIGLATPKTNDQYSTTVFLTTDSNGVLSVSATSLGSGSNTSNDIRINGFQIVPEPASASLLLGGVLMMLHRRRR